MESTIMVPPDGGWGWMVVIGVNIVAICTRSLDACFGLLFGDLLKELKIETAGASLIASTLLAVTYFSGLVIGPIIRRFSYRKITALGGVLCALGLTCSFPAQSMAHILITYSIFFGLGLSLASSATFIATNHYFVKRRGLAIGLGLVGGAIGTTVFPQLISIFLYQYEYRGTLMLMGGVVLHALIGACLLQPAKWHFVPAVETRTTQQTLATINEEADETNQKLLRSTTAPELNTVIEDLPPPQKQSLRSRKFSIVDVLVNARKMSVVSNNSEITTMDFPGSLQLYIEATSGISPISTSSESTSLQRRFSQPTEMLYKKPNEDIPEDVDVKKSSSPPTKQPKRSTPLKSLVEFFDFDLLKDPIYLNLIFGIAMFYVGDQNFRMVAVFFYEDIGYSKSEIALLISIQASSDIVSRLTLPTLCEKVPVTKRTIFMSAMLGLAVLRSVLAFQTQFTSIAVCLAVSGFIRGLCVINSSVTLSEHVTLEKLPAAYGLHMVARGIFIITLGPLLGYIRDAFNSFPLCIHLQSSILSLCFIAWTTEYTICWIISRKKNIIRKDVP